MALTFPDRECHFPFVVFLHLADYSSVDLLEFAYVHDTHFKCRLIEYR